MPKHAASRLCWHSPQVATMLHMLSAICGCSGVCVIVSVVNVFRKKLQRKCVHPKKCYFCGPNVVTKLLGMCRVSGLRAPPLYRKWLHLHVTGRSDTLKVAPRIVYPSTDCAHAHVHTHMQNDLQRYYQHLPRRVSGKGVYGSDVLAPK